MYYLYNVLIYLAAPFADPGAALAGPARSHLPREPARTLRFRADHRRPDDLDSCGLGRRGAGGAAAHRAAAQAPPGLQDPAHDRDADGGRARAPPVRRPGAAALRAIRPAGLGQALLRPRAAEARDDPRNRALAEPVRRVRPARRAARARERAHLAAFGRQVPPARAALSQDALARDPDRGAKRVGRRTLPVHRRGDGPHPHHRQHQVRLPAARRHRGAGQALARAVRAGPAASGSRAARTKARRQSCSMRTGAWSRSFPNALLVLVPRHPQRFETVRDLLAKRHERASPTAPPA